MNMPTTNYPAYLNLSFVNDDDGYTFTKKLDEDNNGIIITDDGNKFVSVTIPNHSLDGDINTAILPGAHGKIQFMNDFDELIAEADLVIGNPPEYINGGYILISIV